MTDFDVDGPLLNAAHDVAVAVTGRAVTVTRTVMVVEYADEDGELWLATVSNDLPAWDEHGLLVWAASTRVGDPGWHQA